MAQKTLTKEQSKRIINTGLEVITAQLTHDLLGYARDTAQDQDSVLYRDGMLGITEEDFSDIYRSVSEYVQNQGGVTYKGLVEQIHEVLNDRATTLYGQSQSTGNSRRNAPLGLGAALATGLLLTAGNPAYAQDDEKSVREDKGPDAWEEEEQPPVEQPPVEQPPIEQPAGEQPAGEQPAGEQPAGEQPAGEQPAGEQPAGEQPAGEQPPAADPIEISLRLPLFDYDKYVEIKLGGEHSEPHETLFGEGKFTARYPFRAGIPMIPEVTLEGELGERRNFDHQGYGHKFSAEAAWLFGLGEFVRKLGVSTSGSDIAVGPTFKFDSYGTKTGYFKQGHNLGVGGQLRLDLGNFLQAIVGGNYIFDGEDSIRYPTTTDADTKGFDLYAQAVLSLAFEDFGVVLKANGRYADLESEYESIGTNPRSITEDHEDYAIGGEADFVCALGNTGWNLQVGPRYKFIRGDHSDNDSLGRFEHDEDTHRIGLNVKVYSIGTVGDPVFHVGFSYDLLKMNKDGEDSMKLQNPFVDFGLELKF